MARSTDSITVNLTAQVVEVTAKVAFCTDSGMVVGTTEIDLTPTVKRNFGGEIVNTTSDTVYKAVEAAQRAIDEQLSR